VDAAGQPTPGPFKFWRVMIAASIRVAASEAELPVGNDKATEGLLTAWPAATLALRSAVKVARSGGQEQGIRMPLIPTQLPVPSGEVPAVTPNAGIKEAGTRDELSAAAAGAGAGAAARAGAGAAAAGGDAVPA